MASTLPPPASPDITRQVSELLQQAQQLTAKAEQLAQTTGVSAAGPTRLEIFHGYIGVFIIAFLVTLAATPIMRRLAVKHGVVDRPSEARKAHRTPVAYLGGIAVYVGILAGIVFAYAAPFHGLLQTHPTKFVVNGPPGGVPISVLLGMTVIMLCGLLDDVVGIDPRAKIAGMLFAAACLAVEDVGVKVAAGLMIPIAQGIGIHVTKLPGGFETILIHLPFAVSWMPSSIDVVYWVGTAVIAVFVLGACNASNLIDGLDGLLSGTSAISACGLLIVALTLAMHDDGPLDGARIVLCLAVLGGCLGFLPHNFNPATIFLGDTGSLLLGYCTIVIVLMLGDTGRTDLVLAGLVIYAVPIIDTTLAIVRRKISGKKISDADDNHLHHMLKRALGVKGAVLTLYAIAAGFAVLGVALSEGRQRVTYVLVMTFAAYIAVTAIKIARRDVMEKEMATAEAQRQKKTQLEAAASAKIEGVRESA